MNTQQQLARHLYFNEHKTQKEIAAAVGVTEKTIYNWIQQFSWYQQREEEQSMTSLAANNICQQLLAFQQAIATRLENPGVPSIQEINVQCKLINCLDKLRRHSARQAKATYAITDFLHFVAKDDENLGEAIYDKYTLYTAKNISRKPVIANDKTPSDAVQEALSATSLPETQPVKTGNEPETEWESPYIEGAPFSEQDFNDYKHLLGNFGKLYNGSQIKFRGRYVVTQWLEYNLYQYCLPAGQRKFINDAKQILRYIDHKTTQEKIRLYLEQQKNRAA